MTLEEIKTAIVDRIDAAWHALEHEVNPDTVRTYVQNLTTDLSTHVLEVEAHLVNHVLDKAKPATVSVDPTSPEPITPTSASGSPSSADPETTTGSELSPSDSSTSSEPVK